MDRQEQQQGQQERFLYTLGHSNHSMEEFLKLLEHFQIQVLVDVRSQPYSRHVPHFGKEALQRALEAAGMRYLYLGRELGGRPHGEEFYDETGQVLHGKLVESLLFQKGMARLEKGLAMYRSALMCSEENPEKCHRCWLLGRFLQEQGVEVRHIRGDGILRGQREVASPQEKSEGKESYRQMRLF